MKKSNVILEVIFKILGIVTLPLLVFGYALYGFRVWCWNFENRSAWKGEWDWKIRNKSDKV